MRKEKIVLIIASMGVFIEALDIAIINLAIPSIQKALQLTAGQVQWLQTLYVLFYGGFLIPGGKLSDTYGMKKAFLAGCTIFLLASTGAGLSPSYSPLIVFRALQGMGAALIMPSAFSIISNTFTTEQERGWAMGIFSSFAAIGSGAGLALGGLITGYLGWQWIFFINVPVIIVVILLAAVVLDKPSPRKKHTPNLLSSLLLIATLVMLSMLIQFAAKSNQNKWYIISLATLVVTTGGIFYNRIKKQEKPLIDLKLFHIRSVRAGNCLFTILGAFFTGYLFLISIILQQQLHCTTAFAGIILVPYSILSAIIAKYLLPKIIQKFAITGTAYIGMSSMFVGGLLLILATQYNSLPLLLAAAAAIAGVGITLCFTGFTVISLQQVPPEHYGISSSMTSTSYFFGGGIGLSMLTSFMTNNKAETVTCRIPIIVLTAYAAVGLLILFLFYRKTKANEASIQPAKLQVQ